MADGIVRFQKIEKGQREFSRKLRREQTVAEEALWQALRGKKLNGWKFRRQQIIGPFIADFYCHSENVVVELDGGIHDSAEQAAYDQARTDIIQTHQIRLLRLTNEEVLSDLAGTLHKITAFLHHHPD